jgi:hypothetical protein
MRFNIETVRRQNWKIDKLEKFIQNTPTIALQECKWLFLADEKEIMMQEKYLENYLHYGDCELIEEKEYRVLCFTLFDPGTDNKEETERDII